MLAGVVSAPAAFSAEPPKTLRLIASQPIEAANAARSQSRAGTRPGMTQPGTTRLRLFSQSDQQTSSRDHVEVQRVVFDAPVPQQQWRERADAGQNGGYRIARAPATTDATPTQLPLDGPAPASGQDETLGWTPRSSGAKLLGKPVSPDRASYGPSYSSELAPAPPNTTPTETQDGVDPFDDPFGDGVGTAPLTVRRPTLQDRSLNLQDAAPAPPAASGDFSSEPQADPQPAPLTPPNKRCKHVYNGVDCCEEGERCAQLKQLVYAQSIRNISLDMTPRFKPGADAAEESVEKSRRLAQVESRDWISRQGEVLATGRFVDLRDQRVIVESEDGERIPLRFGNLSETDRCYVTAWWSLPTECMVADEVYNQRRFMPITMTWKASALCHKPLYFEQVQVERYGHTAGPLLQPTLSTAHFFVNAFTLPYNMGVHPLNECQYPLGHYRPGECAPWLIPATPISLRGALYQTGAIVGGVYILP